MASYLARLNPIPGFPEYTGPYKVGTIDVEIPISELESPSPTPDESISTIQYRVFYPCEPDDKGKTINWLPSPQREHVAAYTRFLGAGSTLAEFISSVQSYVLFFQALADVSLVSSLDFCIISPFQYARMRLYYSHLLLQSDGP